VFRSGAGQLLLDSYLSARAISDLGVFDVKRVAWLVAKLRRSQTSFHDDLAILWILSTQVLARRYGVSICLS
jgi:asparagine synthase (glutamine-hydrolysing)